MIGNHVYPQGYRGFESLSLRHAFAALRLASRERVERQKLALTGEHLATNPSLSARNTAVDPRMPLRSLQAGRTTLNLGPRRPRGLLRHVDELHVALGGLVPDPQVAFRNAPHMTEDVAIGESRGQRRQHVVVLRQLMRLDVRLERESDVPRRGPTLAGDKRAPARQERDREAREATQCSRRGGRPPVWM
jgi:hypothetical protein